MVRVTRNVAGQHVRSQHGRTTAEQRSRRAETFSRQSICECASEAGTSGAVAVLVHHARGKARNGQLVEAAKSWAVCPDIDSAEWTIDGDRCARHDGASGVVAGTRAVAKCRSGEAVP